MCPRFCEENEQNAQRRMFSRRNAEVTGDMERGVFRDQAKQRKFKSHRDNKKKHHDDSAVRPSRPPK